MTLIEKFVRSVGTDMQPAPGGDLEGIDLPRGIKKRIPSCTRSIHDAFSFSCTLE